MVNNPYIIVQARMNSERLPGKVMMTAGGKPLIGILIDRIKDCGIPILLATSKSPENERLVEYVKSIGVKVFRGSEENVLERYYLASKSVKADLILRLTGDNPFIDSTIINDVFVKLKNSSNQRAYISTALGKTWPLGISVEAFSFNLLEEAFLNAVLPGEYEHVTPYMHQNIPGDIDVIPHNLLNPNSQYRLTVDTIEDFNLFEILVEKYNAEERNVIEIIELLTKHPELFRINRNVIQKGWN